MVDAVGGVDMCIPHVVDDRVAHIALAAGRQRLSGTDAPDYVRERESLGNESAVGRIGRQQAFTPRCSTRARGRRRSPPPSDPVHRGRHLLALRRPRPDGLGKIAGLAWELRHIGLSRVQFVTTPWATDPTNANRVLGVRRLRPLWRDVLDDKVLPKAPTTGTISADLIPGVTHRSTGSAGAHLDAGICA